MLGWAAATGLLPTYVALAGRISPALGSLGGGLIVLAWLYLLMLSLFLGAEINASLQERAECRLHPGVEDQPRSRGRPARHEDPLTDPPVDPG